VPEIVACASRRDFPSFHSRKATCFVLSPLGVARTSLVQKTRVGKHLLTARPSRIVPVGPLGLDPTAVILHSNLPARARVVSQLTGSSDRLALPIVKAVRPARPGAIPAPQLPSPSPYLLAVVSAIELASASPV